MGATEAFSYSKKELLHTFESVCSAISAAVSNRTRGAAPPPPAARGRTPCLLTLQPELAPAGHFVSLLRVTTFYSCKRPIQSNNRRIVKHKKHLLCVLEKPLSVIKEGKCFILYQLSLTKPSPVVFQGEISSFPRTPA